MEQELPCPRKTSNIPQYHHDGIRRPVQLLIHQTEQDDDKKVNMKDGLEVLYIV